MSISQKTTRRSAIFAGLAAVATTGTAKAIEATAPDPVFAAIGAFQAAQAELDAANKALSDLETELFKTRPPGAQESHDRAFTTYDRLYERRCQLRDQVCATVPTTTAGAAALVRFIQEEIAPAFAEAGTGFEGLQAAALASLEAGLLRA